jgi:predicted RNA binding protein YcfA (HicA-like mRNA interferase family)
MKRRALLSHLQEHGCVSVREGGSHSIWSNPQTGRKEAIPRHNEIKKFLARSICRRLSVPNPPGD